MQKKARRKKEREKGENTTCSASARRRTAEDADESAAHVLTLYSGYAWWLMMEAGAIPNNADLAVWASYLGYHQLMTFIESWSQDTSDRMCTLLELLFK